MRNGLLPAACRRLLLYCIGLVAITLACSAQTWEALGPFGASITTLAISPTSPDTMYAAGGSVGIFRSTDGGGTWARTGFTRSDTVGSIVFASQSVYAGTSSGFYVSEDEGITWSQRNHGLSSSYLYALAVDPTDTKTIYAGAWGGLFKTTTAGEEWEDIGGSLGEVDVRALIIDPTNSAVVYAGTASRGVFRSADGGQTWLPCSNGLSDLSIWDLVIDEQNPQVLYAATNSSGVYRTEDGAATWVSATEGIHGGSFRLVVDPKASSTLYVGTQGNGVFRSTDRGTTWEHWNEGLPSRESVYGIAVRPDTGEVVSGLFSQGVYLRAPEGGGWVGANTGMNGYVVSSLAISGSSGELLVGIETYGPSVFRSADAGITWTMSKSGMNYPPVYTLVQDPADASVLLSGNAGSLFRSSDGGVTWVPSDTGLNRGWVSVFALLFDRQAPSTVLAGANSGIWLSTDAGLTWAAQQQLADTVRALAQGSWQLGLLLAGGDRGTLYRSADHGAHWTSSGTGLPANASIRAICFDPVVPGVAYVGTDGNGIYRSDDKGTTWSLFLTSPETARTFALTAVDDAGVILAATSEGVYVFDHEDAQPQPIGSTFLEGSLVRCLLYDESAGFLYAGGTTGLFRVLWEP